MPGIVPLRRALLSIFFCIHPSDFCIAFRAATFTMDLNTGLTQALSESAPQGYGTTTYLHGYGRIAQLNTDTLMTDYFLDDALGSTRQLTDAQGQITLAKAYDPYGVVSLSAGAGQSSYGYTNEYQDSYIQLVYLRARMYAPSMGRFLSRDTWAGDYNRPGSLNRWGYVEGNPINAVDPTGHSPWYSPRFLCQMFPNKEMYERCVGTIYRIEPVNYAGEFVDGEKGCYKGPKYYRAPGYFKGTGITLALPWIVNWRFAIESVYDFATFEHAYFTNGTDWAPIVLPGFGASDFVWGGILEQYVGVVYGFRTDTGIESDYPGWALTGFLGISGGPGPVGTDPLGPSIGAGAGGFISLIDPKIEGNGVYANVGFGLDIFPIYIDAGMGLISMTKAPFTTVTTYRNGSKIDKAKLFNDILNEKHNVWLTNLIPPADSLDFPNRVVAAAASYFYGLVYEDINSDYE